MNITPKAGPTIIQPGPNASKAAEARAKAISMLEGSKTPQAGTTVQNASRVSAEELSAVKAPEVRPDTTIEASTETVKEAPKTEAEEQLSSHYANLARKERAQRARDAQLKAREEALRLKEAALTAPKTESIDTSKYIQADKLRQNPLEVLSELGLSYEQITELAMNAPKQEDVTRRQYEAKIEAELQALRSEQEKTKKFYEDQQSQAYQQAVTQIRNEASSLVRNNPEFEMINTTKSVNDVVELIERTYKEENVLLSVEEASKAVEDYLVEEALKLSKVSKIQQRLKPASTDAVLKQTTEKQAPTLKTLTNQNSSSRPLSAKERAILAFKNELK